MVEGFCSGSLGLRVQRLATRRRVGVMQSGVLWCRFWCRMGKHQLALQTWRSVGQRGDQGELGAMFLGNGGGDRQPQAVAGVAAVVAYMAFQQRVQLCGIDPASVVAQGQGGCGRDY